VQLVSLERSMVNAIDEILSRFGRTAAAA